MVDDLSRPIWDKEKELAWLGKVLPQLSEKDRVIVTKGLIKVAKTGALAWGQFSDGIITLSDIAAEGTTYHEAFHAVFNLLTDTETREALYAEARQKFGNRDNAELEELMAEDFREYVMSRDSRTIGRKILDFFKNLLIKTTNWKHITPHLTVYYRMINEGKYANRTDSISSIKDLRSEDNIKYRVSPNTQVKPGVSELFESNPELANEVYEALELNIINRSEITYTDEEGNLCAKMGLTNTVKGSDWKIVKDFKGKPKHSNGGVDITISDKGVTMRRGSKDIKAKYGLLIPNNN